MAHASSISTMDWMFLDWFSSHKLFHQLPYDIELHKNYQFPCSTFLGSTCWRDLVTCFDGRGWVLTSWLRRSVAKSSSQDLYSSMPSAVLRTSCGLSIRQGNPKCKTDSTAVAQLLSVILPVRKRPLRIRQLEADKGKIKSLQQYSYTVPCCWQQQHYFSMARFSSLVQAKALYGCTGIRHKCIAAPPCLSKLLIISRSQDHGPAIIWTTGRH